MLFVKQQLNLWKLYPKWSEIHVFDSNFLMWLKMGFQLMDDLQERMRDKKVFMLTVVSG